MRCSLSPWCSRTGRRVSSTSRPVRRRSTPRTPSRVPRRGEALPHHPRAAGRWTFDSRANGYVRGEGGAVVVLKRLSAALADGDDVQCVVLGGAVNNDGGGDGLAVPNGAAQQELLLRACRHAGVTRPRSSTSSCTAPVPRSATRSRRPRWAPPSAGPTAEQPLLVGSVKTNIGHLEGAAGIAGFVKAAWPSRTGRCRPASTSTPPTRRSRSTSCTWTWCGRTGTGPATGCWPGSARSAWAARTATSCSPRRPRCRPTARARRPPVQRSEPGPAWVLSARDVPALRAQAARLVPAPRPASRRRAADVALSLLTTRARFEHRAVLLGADRPTRLAALDALAAGRPDETVVTGRAVSGKRVLVFAGQGSQWPGMARDLLDTEPAFARRMTECVAALAPYLDYDLLEVLREAQDLDRTEVAQPAQWAVMTSLAALWRDRGLVPDVVIGHSQGEIAAATVIGALTLDGRGPRRGAARVDHPRIGRRRDAGHRRVRRPGRGQVGRARAGRRRTVPGRSPWPARWPNWPPCRRS